MERVLRYFHADNCDIETSFLVQPVLVSSLLRLDLLREV